MRMIPVTLLTRTCTMDEQFENVQSGEEERVLAKIECVMGKRPSWWHLPKELPNKSSPLLKSMGLV